jgi:hypothetical protein
MANAAQQRFAVDKRSRKSVLDLRRCVVVRLQLKPKALCGAFVIWSECLIAMHRVE